jgi:hypothetical protein
LNNDAIQFNNKLEIIYSNNYTYTLYDLQWVLCNYIFIIILPIIQKIIHHISNLYSIPYLLLNILLFINHSFIFNCLKNFIINFIIFQYTHSLFFIFYIYFYHKFILFLYLSNSKYSIDAYFYFPIFNIYLYFKNSILLILNNHSINLQFTYMSFT